MAAVPSTYKPADYAVPTLSALASATAPVRSKTGGLKARQVTGRQGALRNTISGNGGSRQSNAVINSRFRDMADAVNALPDTQAETDSNLADSAARIESLEADVAYLKTALATESASRFAQCEDIYKNRNATSTKGSESEVGQLSISVFLLGRAAVRNL